MSAVLTSAPQLQRTSSASSWPHTTAQCTLEWRSRSTASTLALLDSRYLAFSVVSHAGLFPVGRYLMTVVLPAMTARWRGV